MTDNKFIIMALELAKKGYGRVSPNPVVDAVIIVQTAAQVPTILATASDSGEKQALLKQAGCEIMVLPTGVDGHVDLKLLMAALGQKKIDSILLEDGSALNWSALESKNVKKSNAISPQAIWRRLGKVSGGGSVAVNGDCLTVMDFGNACFSSDVMHETLNRSSLGDLKIGSHVNLERAMAAGRRFSGHMVSGHIEGTGTISTAGDSSACPWAGSWCAGCRSPRWFPTTTKPHLPFPSTMWTPSLESPPGIAHVSLTSGIPVMFGVLTTENIEQAIERAGTKAGNKGFDCAVGAIEMVNLIREIEA